MSSNRSFASSSRRTQSTKATSVSSRAKRSSAYDKDFEQNLIDHNIFPRGYEYPDDEPIPEPGNLDDVVQALAAPRASLSPSQFSRSAFQDFARNNDRVISESNRRESSLHQSRHSPLLTREQWASLLKDQGFSGIDLCLTGSHIDLMVSAVTRNNENASTQQPQSNATSDSHSSVVPTVDEKRDWLLVYIEIGPDRVSTSAEHVQIVPECTLDHRSRAGLQRGLTRHLVTLAFESPRAGESWTEDAYLSFILEVFKSSFVSGGASVAEWEYIVRDGNLCTHRMVQEVQLESAMQSRVKPSIVKEPCFEGPPLMLDIGTPGILDSLRLVEDPVAMEPLKPEEVEVEAAIWPLAFRDVFVALGKFPGEEMGLECVGKVRRVGSSVSSLNVGDNVCVTELGCMRVYPRAPSSSVFKVPDSIPLEEMAAMLSPGITSYYSLITVARLQPGERILIHSAAGATGQAAVSVAQFIGAEVFATVGSDDKKQLLMDKFGIPANRIFYSRNLFFADGIKRETNGVGVDVILNSLAGEGLRATWECIAPYGRFIEIGKTDIFGNSPLPMSKFAKNVSFCAVDLFHIIKTNHRLVCELVQSVTGLMVERQIVCPSPIQLHPLSKAEQAFRSMQSGQNMGRVMISVDRQETVSKFIKQRDTWELPSNASYVIAGGFGGLGRAILRWLADRGARYLIVPSRSGATSEESRRIVDELQERGVHVLAPRCNVSSADEVAALLKDCEPLPPIKGCINSAMALEDSVFEGMSHDQWQKTIASKVAASWNLHQQLPSDLDFFILLSSLAGIYGSLAQSNYAAGCTFQDDLARFRNANHSGRSSVSLDLGWMVDIGIVSEREDYQRNRGNARDMNPVTSANLLAILSHYCDPTLASFTDKDQSQLLVGAATPMDMHVMQTESIFEVLPMLANFAVAKAIGKKTGSASQQPGDHPAQLFQQAGDRKERAIVVVQTLMARLARALHVPENEIDSNKPLSEYGVDSLMAIELRNWIKRDFQASVAVFDLMGEGQSIAAIGVLVTEKSEILD